jgi:hypothetical protein
LNICAILYFISYDFLSLRHIFYNHRYLHRIN